MVLVEIVMKSLFSFGDSVIVETFKISHSSDDSSGSISIKCICCVNDIFRLKQENFHFFFQTLTNLQAKNVVHRSGNVNI